MSFFSGRRQHEDSEERAAATGDKPAVPPAPRQPVGFQTVLGSTTAITGEIRGSGNARFDGILDGALEIDGNILIGETAKITADINARNISIAGAVRGNVNGNKVQILRTGRVWGDINAAAITTEEGAFIDGKITMVSHEAALQNLEVPALEEPEAIEEPDFMAEVDAAREAEELEEVEVIEEAGADVLEEIVDVIAEEVEEPRSNGIMNLFGFGQSAEETPDDAEATGLEIDDADDDQPRYELD